MAANKVNIKDFLDSLDKQFLPKARAVMKQAVYEYASAVLTDAKELCPIKTGNLAASGSVSEVEEIGGKLKVTIGFNTHYAVFVHEMPPDRAHHLPPTQWKFLAKPMQERAPGFAPYVAEKLQEAFA